MAYTLVSICVLLLRYQPKNVTLVDLLPESIRTPLPGTPIAGTPSQDFSSASSMFPIAGAEQHHPTQDYRSSTFPNGPAQRLSLSLGIGQTFGSVQPPPVVSGGPVLVRKVTRTSPDSDDTDTIDTDADDAFLVADRNESRYYGSVHAAASPRMSRWQKQMR